jgi:hypothetical protein
MTTNSKPSPIGRRWTDKAAAKRDNCVDQTAQNPHVLQYIPVFRYLLALFSRLSLRFAIACTIGAHSRMSKTLLEYLFSFFAMWLLLLALTQLLNLWPTSLQNWVHLACGLCALFSGLIAWHLRDIAKAGAVHDAEQLDAVTHDDPID